MESGALTINTAVRLSQVEQFRSVGQDLPEMEGGTNIPNAVIRSAPHEMNCEASRSVSVAGSEEFPLLERAHALARRGPFLLLIVVFLLSGCSIINPYVRPDDANWKMASAGAGSYAGDLAGAIDYANSWRVTYYKAVGDRALLRNSSALGLLGLGGAALGYGLAAGNNGAVFAGLGAAGATLFGSSSYFQSTPRDRTYLAGSQAIGCALLAVRPLIMTEADFQNLTGDLAQLRASIFTVQTTLDTVRRSTDAVRDLDIGNPYLPVAETAISNARAALMAANETYKNGKALHSNVATAGYTLRVTVDNIVATVGEGYPD